MLLGRKKGPFYLSKIFYHVLEIKKSYDEKLLENNEEAMSLGKKKNVNDSILSYGNTAKNPVSWEEGIYLKEFLLRILNTVFFKALHNYVKCHGKMMLML